MKILSLLLILATSAFAAPETITLTTTNTVVFRTEVTEQSVFQAEMMLLEQVAIRGAKSYPIYLVLDSPGGSIGAGEDFIAFVKTIPNVKTVTIFAASMAAGFVQGLPGERLITSNGTLMFHRARGGVDGQLESGELESRLGYYKEYIRLMEQRNANRMKMKLDTYKFLVINEWWILGAQAIKSNAADRVVELKCTPELINKADITRVPMMLGFSISVAYSRCPLIKYGIPVRGQPEELYKKYNEHLKKNAKQ